MSPFRLAITTIVFLAASIPLKPQPMTSIQIDDLVERAMKTFDVPGMAIAVVRDGRLSLARGYGVRSTNAQAHVDANTMFGIASNTKAFTAAAIGILVDEGKLKWDDKVTDYIPEFKMYDPCVTKEFTIRDLLTHRSGLAKGAGELMQDPSPTTFTINDIIHSLRYFKPVSSFRTHFAYSNIMYIVAGEVIARVSGLSWENFVSARILKPLKMDHSGPSYRLVKFNPNVIEPHVMVDGAAQVTKRVDDAIDDPAGGIYSSANDMSKWVVMQLNDGRYGDDLENRLFSEAVHKEMWTPQTIVPVTSKGLYNTHFAAYGLGWFLIDAKGYKEVFHTGEDTGMVSNVVMIPELKLGIVALANQEAPAAVESVADQILDSYLNITGTDHIKAEAEKLKLREQANKASTAIRDEVANRKTNLSLRVNPQMYVGVYKDPWFGDVFVTFRNGGLWFRSERSPLLAGSLFPYKRNTFVIKWANPSVGADAFVLFDVKEGSARSLTLKPLLPGSGPYFGDLDFRRIGRNQASN